MPTGHAAQRRLHPLTMSIQNSKAGLVEEGGESICGYINLVSFDLIEGGIDFLIEVVKDMSLHWLSPHSTEQHHRTNHARTGHNQPLASILRSVW
jgi:hypothetical protein